MKVLHVPYTYPPAAGGGTEVYVAQLCRQLAELGVESVVAVPGQDSREGVVGGTRTRWFEMDPRPSLDVLYGAGDQVAADAFDQLLVDEQPDVVHQHAVSPACSVELTRRTVRRGIPVVLTVHTPAVFCQQGAMMRWGHEPCSVAWDLAACTSCVLATHGVPALAAAAMARMPSALGAVSRLGAGTSATTAFRLPTLMRQRLAAVDELFGLADSVVALAPWVADVLARNGVPSARIATVPHGLDLETSARRPRLARQEPVRLVYLGRLEAVKGTLLVAEALAALPGLPVRFDIYGLTGHGTASCYEQALRRVAGRDTRIHLHPPVAHEEIASVLDDCDAVVVPSQGFETGPLVVLEAFARGVPVVGSRLGGLADKVRDGVDGLLVNDYSERRAWESVIRRCVDHPSLLPRLAANTRQPRTMAAVARDMAAIYRGALSLGTAAS